MPIWYFVVWYNKSKCVFYCFSRMSANNAKVESVQAGNNVQAPPVPPVPPFNLDTIMASAEGGSFLLQSVKQYITLSEEQRKMFTACFF